MDSIPFHATSPASVGECTFSELCVVKSNHLLNDETDRGSAGDCLPGTDSMDDVRCS